MEEGGARSLSTNNVQSANPNAIPCLKDETLNKDSSSTDAPVKPKSQSQLPLASGTNSSSSNAPPIQSNSITSPISNVINRSPPRQPGNPPLSLNLGGGADGLKKKPSLSQRRGMKLDMGDLQKDLALQTGEAEEPQTNPPMNTTGELSRRISERKNKPNFKLNLNDGISNGGGANPTGTGTGELTSSASDGSPVSGKKSQLRGLFANYSKYVDIKSGSLNFSGKASLHSKGVDFLSGSSFRISLDELEFIEELGRGNYGTVLKVLHKPTGVLMAMKEVRLELDETKFTQILMELDILHKCNSPFIVDFYGAFFVEGAVYMCMEYMDGGSLDKICVGEGVQLEAALAYILELVIRGLKELKDVHNIIHRDVKPTNILVNTLGKVKLCDFGVSGNLVASLAKTNIGCQSYMAPERIKTQNPDDASYSVQSDIWSLGLTILEIAAGHYPYPPETYGNIFLQLKAIVDGEPPKLDPKVFLKDAQYFIKLCLNKNPDLRPSYSVLLNNPWLVRYREIDPKMDEIVTERVKILEEEKSKRQLVSRSNSVKRAAEAAGVAPAAAAGIGELSLGAKAPPNRENVRSLLKNKVRAPALHRRPLPERGPPTQMKE